MHLGQLGLPLILNKLKQWLSPPIFEGDEEKTRLARIGNTIALAIITVLGVYTFARPQFFLKNAESAIANVILLFLLISQLFFIRRGWVRFAALTITSLAWLNLTIQAWLFGGVRDVAFAAYLLIILVASLMLGWRAALIFLLLSVSSGLGMAHAEAVGVLPFAPDNPYALWLDHSLNFVIATILVTVMVTSLSQTLGRARRNEQTLAERNRELQATKTLLETQIAERERTQQQLRTSEEMYRQTVENSPNPIFSVDRVGRILTWNPACEKILQYDQRMVGAPYQNILWCPEQSNTIEPLFQDVIERARFLSGLEIPYRCQDGTRRVMMSRLYPTLDQQGEVVACVFANTDITDRVQMEEALKQSEERHRLVVENANEAIIVAQAGQLKFFNTKLMELTGCYSREEMGAMPFTQFVHPDDRALVVERHVKRLKGEECPQVYAFRVIDKDGKVTWVEINAIRISWEEEPAVLFFLSDITERKKAQDELAESEQRYRQLVKHAPAGIYEIDFLNSRFIDVNDVMCEYSGYSCEEFLSLSPLDILTEDSQKRFMARTAKVLAGETLPETTEFQFVTKSGQLLWVLVNTSVTIENGKPARATAIAHNITERKQTEAELDKHRAHLEELVEERTAELTAINLRLQAEIVERKRAEQASTESHERLLTILDGIDADIYAADMESYEILFMNRHMQNRFGQNLVGQVCWEKLRDAATPCPFCTNEKLVDADGEPTGVQIWEGENPLVGRWYVNYDRAIRWVDGRLVRLQIAMDITERKLVEEQVKASLQEKEVLLKEIHHRVKNNLQVISSLLSLQSSYIEDRKFLGVLDDSQHRVRSMALIHEKLYQSANLAQIDFGDYIRELASYLLQSQDTHLRGITLNVQVTDTFLDIDTAVPCGLIINELVSNSLKHAFPKGQNGEIFIKMWAIDRQQVTLIVGDNGLGFPQELDFRETESLGLQLVNTLVEQLEGVIELGRNNGSRFTINFALPQRNN